MDVTVSQRLKAVLLTARSSAQSPATGLQVVTDALSALIPEVEALEASQGARNSTPGPLDELRRKGDEAQATIRNAMTEFKTGLRSTFVSAADALDRLADTLLDD